MNPDEEQGIMVCSKDKPQIKSIIKQCFKCGEDVHVSLASHQRVIDASYKIHFVCLECLTTLRINSDKIQAMSPEQIQEIEGRLGREFTREDQDFVIDKIKTELRTARAGEN